MFSSVGGFRFISKMGLRNGIYLFDGINDIAQGYQRAGGLTYFTSSTGVTNGAIVTAQLASDNSIAWARDLSGTSTNETASNMVIDSSDNVYVVGATNASGAGNLDCYVSKYNSSGSLQWQRTVGTSATDRFYDIALVDSNANIMITGTANVGSSPEGTVLKLSSSTGLLVDQVLGGNISTIKTIATDNSGNIYILLTETLTASREYAVVIKMDSSFTQVWARNIGYASPSTVDMGGQAIGVDNSGNVYVTVRDSVNNDFFLKFNSGGTLQWQTGFNYSFNNGIYAMTLDTSGNIYLAGDFGSTSIVASLLKFDSSGTLLWGRGLNGYGGTEDTSVNNISWYNGKVLMNGYGFYAGTRYGMLLDVPDDGSLLGTYSGGFVWGFSPFATASSSLTVGTASQSLNTSALTEAAGTLTDTSSTISVIQNIPF